jgi:hypothetical protein
MLGQVGALLSAMALTACSVFGIRDGTEEPKYQVIGHAGTVEIREYAPRLAAQTTVATADADAARSAGFRRLAGYIFGGNHGGESIAMTAPVATSQTIAMTAPVGTAPAGDGGWTVTFYMPAKYTPQTLPVPNDPAVRIVTVPAQTVAVYRYSGFISDSNIADARKALLAALAGSQWSPVGEVYDWFYDPPWTLPPLRRNEAVVDVSKTP